MTRALLQCIALSCLAGCEAVTEFPLKVVLPEDSSSLDTADNLTVTLTPTGELVSQATVGTDFSVELDLPADTLVQATLYLARGSELLAWGRTPYFLDVSPSGLALFLGRPGQLSTLPRPIDDPDPQGLAAYLPNRGVTVLAGDGTMRLLSEYTLEFASGPTLPVAVEGRRAGLFTTSDGVVFVSWGSDSSAYRFDLETTTWVELSNDAPDATEVEDDAPRAALYDTASHRHTGLVLYGSQMLWRLQLETLDDGSDALSWSSPDGGAAPDGPRPGASAIALPDDELLVFGSEQNQAVLWSSAVGAFGPAGPWTGGSCVLVDPEANPMRVLCAGGERDGAAVSDLLLLERDPDSGTWTVEERLDALPAALRDPLWFFDETALYAQGAGQLLRIARDSLEPDNAVSSAQRFAEGHSVQLPTWKVAPVGRANR